MNLGIVKAVSKRISGRIEIRAGGCTATVEDNPERKENVPDAGRQSTIVSRNWWE
jgi:hypothetical protein